jgi:hypothetical protein
VIDIKSQDILSFDHDLAFRFAKESPDGNMRKPFIAFATMLSCHGPFSSSFFQLVENFFFNRH